MDLPRIPKSVIEGIGWPALPSPEGRAMLALLGQWEQTQWYSPEQLRALQFRQLDNLLSHASRTVTFHSSRLLAAGYRAGTPLTENVWSRIPILKREELQQAGNTLRTTALPKSHGRVGRVTSSGSTGTPISALGTDITHFFWRTLTVREGLWRNRDFTQTHAAVKNFADGHAVYPQGHSQPNWGTGFAAVYETGPSHFLSINSTTQQQAEWIERVKPAYLQVFPSALLELAHHCRTHGQKWPWLKEFRTLGEIVTPELRAACREIWGVSIADIYSAEEVGTMAFQCPEQDHYHVQSETTLLEVLDDDGRPCAPGETGRVVVTPLHNFAMPLIRYEIGDYAEVGAPCPCGRGLPVLNRIMGRVRNMLTRPDGSRVWPSISDEGLRSIEPLRQIQVTQTSLEMLEVRVTATRTLDASEHERLRQVVSGRIGDAFEVQITQVNQIERGPGGKYEDVRSHISPNAMATV